MKFSCSVGRLRWTAVSIMLVLAAGLVFTAGERARAGEQRCSKSFPGCLLLAQKKEGTQVPPAPQLSGVTNDEPDPEFRPGPPLGAQDAQGSGPYRRRMMSEFLPQDPDGCNSGSGPDGSLGPAPPNGDSPAGRMIIKKRSVHDWGAEGMHFRMHRSGSGGPQGEGPPGKHRFGSGGPQGEGPPGKHRSGSGGPQGEGPPGKHRSGSGGPQGEGPPGKHRFGSGGPQGEGPPGKRRFGSGGPQGGDSPGMRRIGPGGPHAEGSPGMHRQGGQGFHGGMQRSGDGLYLGPGRRLDLTPLNLTEEQKERIRSIREETRTRAREIRKSMMQQQSRLRDLMFSPDATDNEIRAARTALRRIQDKLDEMNLDDMLSIRNVLTAEQKQKLPEIAPQRGRSHSAGTQAPGDGAPSRVRTRSPGASAADQHNPAARRSVTGKQAVRSNGSPSTPAH